MKMEVKWFGAEIEKKIVKAQEVAMKNSLEYLLEESNKIVPHDEGTLQRSGDTSYDSKRKVGAVFYDTPYAVRLHEHPHYRFQKGRKGKWLEITFKEKGKKVKEYLANFMRNELK